MSAKPWVKWFPADFLHGVVELEPAEGWVYVIVLNLIYDSDGPIKMDVARLARRCRMRPTSVKAALTALIEAEKLFLQDGLLGNGRALSVIKSRRDRGEKSSNAATTRWENERQKANENSADEHADALLTECEGNAILEARSQKPEKIDGADAPLSAEPDFEDEAIGDDAPSVPVRVVSLPSGFPPDAFDQWWKLYPEKVGKIAAAKIFARIAKGRRATFPELMIGLQAYITNKPPDRAWAHATTFLNQGRWADEYGGHNGPRSDARPGRRDSVASAESMLDGAMDALNDRR